MKPSHFRPPTQQASPFHPYTEMKSTSTTHTTTKLFSSPNRNLVRFHRLYWNQVNFVHPYKTWVIFDTYTKTKWFPVRIPKRRQFRLPTEKPCQSIPTLKTSHFRPAHNNKVRLDLITEIKSISIPSLITSRFRCPPKQKPTWFLSRH